MEFSLDVKCMSGFSAFQNIYIVFYCCQKENKNLCIRNFFWCFCLKARGGRWEFIFELARKISLSLRRFLLMSRIIQWVLFSILLFVLPSICSFILAGLFLILIVFFCFGRKIVIGVYERKKNSWLLFLSHISSIWQISGLS